MNPKMLIITQIRIRNGKHLIIERKEVNIEIMSNELESFRGSLKKENKLIEFVYKNK